MTDEERRKWLQRIRRRIAENNGIVYMQSEQHEQDCGGDCKACQAEARYIDGELKRKAQLGEDVRLASILSELLMDVDLTMGVCGKDKKTSNKKDIIDKGNKNKQIMLIEELDLTIHLDNALKGYGVGNTDELYLMLKGDSMNMKKKLRGGYKFLVERLKELGYEITEEMG